MEASLLAGGARLFPVAGPPEMVAGHDGFGWGTTTDDARDGGSGKLVSHFTASSGS